MKLSRRNQVLVLGAALFVLTVVMAVQIGARMRTDPRFATPPAATTLEPAVIDNLTAMPDATGIPGEAGERIATIREQVDGCEDYSPERRFEMTRHILWLQDPTTLPRDVIVELGDDPTVGLLVNMATYTAIEWQASNEPANSCLVSIGRAINELIVSFDGEPLALYDEVDG